MALKLLVVFFMVTIAYAQRAGYAGLRPVGYPTIVNNAPAATDDGSLGNKFGTDDPSTTTQRLPMEALGDRELVNRISKLPIDQQPFWFINWQALEAHRQRPQTWPQKPNTFIDGQSNQFQ